MSKRPRISALLFVYVGLLFCVAFDDVFQLAYNHQEMSGLVSIMIAVIGAVVAQQIWKGREEGAFLGVLGAAGIGILWTCLPVLLAFVFGESLVGVPTHFTLRRIGDYSGAAILGMAVWVFLIVLKAIVQSVWRSLFGGTENPPA